MSAEQLFEQAQNAQQTGDLPAAERLYRALLGEMPDYAPAQRGLAILLFQRGEVAEAERHFARAAELMPGEPYMHQNHAMVLNELQHFNDAIAAADRAIALKPDYGLAYFNRAAAQVALGRYEDAIPDYRRASVLGVSDPFLFFSLGFVLSATGRRDEALAEYDRAIALDPRYIEAIANRGILLKEMGRLHEALAAFDQAILLNPNIAESHNQRGTVLHELKHVHEALAAFQTALALKPDYAKAMFNIGNVLASAGQYAQALDAFDAAAAIAPDLAYLMDTRLHAAMHVCDWRDFDENCTDLFAKVEQGSKAQPFSLLCLPSGQALQRKCAETFAAEKCPPHAPIFRKLRKPGRLRIAYVGTTFRHHPVALLLTGLLENHARDNFEIFGISHCLSDNSDARRRIVATCDKFVDAAGWDDRRIAEQIRDLGIDIAIDIDGYTEDARPGILSFRPAPVQANFLGYPGTMGAGHIDYLIGDSIVTPPGIDDEFSEKIIRLPNSYQPAAPRPSSTPPSRAEAGLPEGAIVFGCFNSAHKITPGVFDSWMRILARVPHSILWLLVDIETARINLEREAAGRGVDPGRLVFASRVDWQTHLSRQALMDIFLDTFVYGAHTTASDALWNGIPLVTMLGETFPARVGASLVTAAGLPELVAATPEEYESIAVALAQDTHRLTALKARLRDNHNGAPLFDAPRYARNIEAAFRTMALRQEKGLPPESFAVEPVA